MNRPKLFFEARMSADDAKVGNVYISGPITSWAWEELNETSGKQVQRALDSVKDAETLNIYIDGPGGYLDEGMTMMRLLKGKRQGKTCVLHGMCERGNAAADSLHEGDGL